MRDRSPHYRDREDRGRASSSDDKYVRQRKRRYSEERSPARRDRGEYHEKVKKDRHSDYHKQRRHSQREDDSESDDVRRRSGERDRRRHHRQRSRSRSISQSCSPVPKRRRWSKDSLQDESNVDGRRRRHGDGDPRTHHRERSRSRSRSPPSKRRRHGSRESRRHSDHHHSHNGKPSPYRRRSHSPNSSRPIRHRSRSAHRSSPPPKRSKAPLPSQKAAYSNHPTSSTSKPPIDDEPVKQKPNYAPSGRLAAESNTVANTIIVLKYNEPPEARLPPSTSPWRLYVFKNAEIIDTIPLHTRSCWLFGREKAVCDCSVEHPSCSKQHAVLQFRYVEKRDADGGRKGGVRPYLIDLESANGTMLNGEKVPPSRYVEVRTGDVVKFGESSREYVVLVPPKDKEKP